MSGISLGNEFNAALAALAGWDTTVDTSTVDVPFVNLAGDETTIRATITANVPTADLKALLTEYAKPTEDPTAPDPATEAPEATDTAPVAETSATDADPATS